jgi:hypothetical protein
MRDVMTSSSSQKERQQYTYIHWTVNIYLLIPLVVLRIIYSLLARRNHSTQSTTTRLKSEALFFVASPATPQSLTPILLIRVDDVHKSGLQAGAAHQETINVLLLGELAAVLLTDASSVDDPRVLRRLGADGFG